MPIPLLPPNRFCPLLIPVRSSIAIMEEVPLAAATICFEMRWFTSRRTVSPSPTSSEVPLGALGPDLLQSPLNALYQSRVSSTLPFV